MLNTSISSNVLTITPLDNQYGSSELSIIANDGSLDSNPLLFNLTVTNVNDAPTLNDISNQEVDEDSDNILLSIIPTDVDLEDDLIVSISSSNSLLIDSEDITIDILSAITDVERLITLNPKDDAYGTSNITVTITDGLESISKEFTITVNAVNDAPVLASIGNQAFDEDEIKNIQISATDIDYTTLSYSITQISDNISAVITDNILSITPSSNYFGEQSITLSVADEELSDSETFTVTINAINDAPVLAAVSDVSFDEDTSGSLSVSGSDIDGDGLTYSITAGTDITAALDGSDISFSAPTDFNGSETFTVTVTDGELSDSQSMTVTILPVNDAPVATTGLIGDTNEDQSIVVNLSGSDIDGDNLTFSLDTDASSGSVSIDGSVATYTPTSNYNGDDSFVFTVSDGELTDTASVTLTITPVNDAPVLAAVSDVSFDEDTSGSLSVSGSDIDGDGLTYSITTGTDITAALDGSDISFSAPIDFNGSETFTVTVTDGELSDSQSMTVTILPVNDAPVATTGLIGDTNEDQSIVVNLSGSDIDGDNLTFSLDTDASSGSVSIDGSIATYTPTSNYNGDDSFVFTVSDGELTDTASVTLTITPVNDTPDLVFDSQDISFDEDTSITVPFSATDIDEDVLSYTITEGVDIITEFSGTSIIFTAPPDFNGNEFFTVTATDGELSDSESFSVTVNSVNDAPVATTGISATTDEDQNIVITILGSDIDENSLEFILESDPTNGSVVITEELENNDNGAFATYTPTPDYNGSDTFTFRVSDGQLFDTASVTVTILPVNDAPVLATVSDFSFDEDTAGTLSFTSNDVDGDHLTYSLIDGDDIFTDLSSDSVIFSAP